MLEEKIREELKESLKKGDKTRVSVVRMLISEMNNRKIEERAEELDDGQALEIVQKMVRQHNESIEKFRQGGREDLVGKETEELVILKEYMPEQLSEEELRGIIDQSIVRTGASSEKDMGHVMKDLMPQVKGRADGKTVSKLVKEKLAK